MGFYTFIMAFQGGTYIAQALGRDVRLASINWARALDLSVIEGLGETARSDLIREMQTQDPTPLDGRTHVWCLTWVWKGDLALINVVKTSSEHLN